MALPFLFNSSSPQDSDSPGLGAQEFRVLKQGLLDAFGIPNATSISGSIMTLGANTDGKVATLPVAKASTPFLRMIGTEVSGRDFRIVELSGQVLLQINDGSEATPTWTTLANLGTGGGSSGGTGQTLPGQVEQRSFIVTGRTYTLSANLIMLVSPTTGQGVFLAPGPLTVNIDVQGADGRDQVNAFNNEFVSLFWIWNGSTLHTLASGAPYPTGVVNLPAGFTHLCFAGTVRVDNAGNFVPSAIVGPNTFYGGVGLPILANGSASVPTAIDMSTAVPSNAMSVYAFAVLDGTGTNPGAPVFAVLSIEPIVATAQQALGTVLTPGYHGGVLGNIHFTNANQTMNYLVSDIVGNPIAGLVASINVNGYENPNSG